MAFAIDSGGENAREASSSGYCGSCDYSPGDARVFELLCRPVEGGLAAAISDDFAGQEGQWSWGDQGEENSAPS